MADELRPYFFGSSSSGGEADADTAAEGGVKEGGSSDGSDDGVPLLTISDINSDMLKVNYLAVDCCFWAVLLPYTFHPAATAVGTQHQAFYYCCFAFLSIVGIACQSAAIISLPPSLPPPFPPVSQ